MRKRRAHGDGGLFARNKGTDRERWVGRLQLPDGTRRDVYGKTQGEARRKLEEMKAAVKAGLPVTSDRLTVGEFLTGWLQNTARPTLRPKVFAGYRSHSTKHLIPRLGKKPLAKLSALDVQQLQNDLLETPALHRGGTLSSGTVLNVRRILGRAMEQATQWGLIARNPVRLVDGPQVTRKEIEPLDVDQARALLAAIRGDRLEALYTVALALGLRRGEALGLKWEDVDFELSAVHVRRALQRADGAFRFVDVKTKKSRRVVPLPLVALRALQKHQRRQAHERELAANLWTDLGLVFCRPNGAPLDPDLVTDKFQRKLKQHGLPHQRFHDLRHACASLLLAQGLDLKVIQEILGHSTITITANLYAHVLMGLKRQAASQMDCALGQPDDELDEVSNSRLVAAP